MSRSKDITKAVEWCKKARDLLKIPRENLWSKDSVESTALSDAIAAVEKRIKVLEKEKKETEADLVTKKFSKLSEMALKAAEDGNKELAQSLTIELNILANATSQTQQQKEESSKALEQQFKISLEKAESSFNELNSFNASPHVFLGTTKESLIVGKNLAKAKDFLGAISSLGKVPAEHKVQLARYAQYQLFPRKKEKVDAVANLVDAVKQNSDKSDPAKKQLADAVQAFDKGDYEEANRKLAAAEELFLSLGKDKEFKGSLPDLFKLRKKLEEKIMKANEVLARSGELYGSKVLSVKSHIDQATQYVSAAKLALKTDGAPTTITEKYNLGIAATENAIKSLSKASEESAKIKKEDKSDTKFALQWDELLRNAQLAHQEMGLNPLAEEVQGKLASLILTSRKLAEAEGIRQYHEAIEKLTAYTQLVDEAKKLKPVVSGVDYGPRITQWMERITPQLKRLAEVAPSYVAAIQNDEAEFVKKTGNDNQDLAVQKLEQLFRAINMNIESYSKRQEEYISKKAEYLACCLLDQDWNAVAKLIPSSEREISRMVDSLAEEHARAKIWDKATDVIKDAIEQIKSFARQNADLQKLEQKWTPRIKELQEINKFAIKTIGFKDVPNPIVLVTWTSNLLSNLNPISKVLLDSDLEGLCEVHFEDIEGEFNELNNALKSKNLPLDLKLLEQFELLKKNNDDEVEQWKQKALSELRGKELQLVKANISGNIFVENNGYRRQIEDVDNLWIAMDFSIDSQLDQKSSEYAKALFGKLADAKDNVTKKYETLIKNIGSLNPVSLAEDIEKRQQEVKDAVPQEDPKNAGPWTTKIDELLNQLDALAVDTQQFRSNYKLIDPNGEGYVTLLKEFSDSLAKTLSQKTDELVKASEQRIKDELEPKMKNVDLGYNYKGYQEQLADELKDVQSLLQSRDPELIKIAMEEMDKLSDRVNAVIPVKGKKGSELYNDVDKKIKELGSLLGTGSDGVVIDYLPQTHEKLDTQLNTAIELARRSSPKEGLAELEKLGEPIRLAVEKAKLVKDDHLRFAQRIKQLKNLWKETRKKTSTLVTERVKPLEKYFDARVEDAENAIKVEDGGIARANQIAKELEDKLNNVLNDPSNPREALFELNAECNQEHIEVKTLAQQFSSEVKLFKEVDREAVKTAFKLREEKETSKDAKKALETERKQVLGGMDKVVSSAKKIVKPYLAMLESLPHKKAKAEPSPDLNKARNAFQQARQILADQKEMARRLSSSGDTTNVRVTGDLKKVQAEWNSRTVEFVQAIKDLSQSIDETGTSILQDPITKDLVKPENIKKAASFVDGMNDLFRTGAFDRPMDVLLNDQSATEERLAARELVLRIMRQQREQILKNPVLRKLSENPINSGVIMSSLGNLRTTLKRVEIETLVGA